MNKSKTARVAAFIGSVGASAALIGMAATNTGAYFTDTEQGNLSGSTGHLALDKTSDYNLSFDNLIPGEYKSREVRYHTDSSSNEDIWLKFPESAAYGALTGNKDGGDGFAGGGLGRFGHFEVKNGDGNTLFSSWNLQNASPGVSGCANANGHGSNTAPINRDATPDYCGIPRYMLIQSDVANGTDGKFTMVFGVTGRSTGQNVTMPTVPFEVVATQHGIRPDASNF